MGSLLLRQTPRQKQWPYLPVEPWHVNAKSLIPLLDVLWLVDRESSSLAKLIESFDFQGLLQIESNEVLRQEAGYVHELVSRMAIWWTCWIKSASVLTMLCGNDSGAVFYVLPHYFFRKKSECHTKFIREFWGPTKILWLLGLRSILPLWQLT
jgi:hypothetical protein